MQKIVFLPQKDNRNIAFIILFLPFFATCAKMKTEIVRWRNIGSPLFFNREEGRVPQGMRFFQLYYAIIYVLK